MVVSSKKRADDITNPINYIQYTHKSDANIRI